MKTIKTTTDLSTINMFSLQTVYTYFEQLFIKKKKLIKKLTPIKMNLFLPSFWGLY